MFISNNSSIFSLLTLFLFLHLLPLLATTNTNSEYSACSALYSCGRIQNIGYPFWGGNRPEYCGAPNFKLNCLAGSNYPTMIIYSNGSLGFTIVDINTSNHTIQVSRERLLHTCYVQDTSKITWIPNLMEKPSYNQITLFYGCNNNNDYCNDFIGNSSKSFTCSNSDNTLSHVYYFEGNKNSSCSCTNRVSVPLEDRLVEELRSTKNVSLWSVLTKSPVEMVYTASFEECSKCEESGGRCGSSGDQFRCYCENGVHQLLCSSSSGQRRKVAIILGTGVALGIMVLVALFISLYKYRTSDKFTFMWSKTPEDENVAAFLKSYGSLAPKRYTYGDIKKMTNSFKDKLGEGGFGVVYKGKLRDGRVVAVKKIKIKEGDDGKEFINEVLSISRTNHVNIVTLIGFCFQGKNRALVFEFLPNGSLDKFIRGGDNNKNPSLDCETMFNIAVGIAKGLDYLHRGCNTRILHFDIKPHNILLDEEFHPKISDFGTARLCPPKYSMISMSVGRGTIGYVAPEVCSRSFGSVSHKSDVYSYGMMLLDLVFGRKKIVFDGQCSETFFFPEWAYNRLDEEVVANGIKCDFKQEIERKMILVSLWCIQTYSSNRPPMNKVVEMLEGPLELLQMPPKPQLYSPERSDEFDTFSITINSTESKG